MRRAARRLSLAVLAACILALPGSASAQLPDGSAVDPVTGAVTDATGQVLGTLDPATGLVLDGAGGVVGVAPGGGSGGGGASPGGAGSAPAGAPAATALWLTLGGPRTQRLRTATRRGVLVRARCSARCGVFHVLTVGRRLARKLRVGSGRRSVVIGTASMARDGGTRVRLSRRARRALARALPSRRTRARARRSKGAALRTVRSDRASARSRRAARRRLSRLRRAQRRWLRGSSIRVNAAAIAFDGAGGVSRPHQRRIRIKR